MNLQSKTDAQLRAEKAAILRDTESSCVKTDLRIVIENL
jgi:hypothetical protein